MTSTDDSDTTGHDESSLGFIEDRPQSGAQAFLHRLDEDERASLYELIDQEIRSEVESEVRKEHMEQMEATRVMVEDLGRAIRWAIDEELRGMAEGALGLAIAVGERLARQTIKVDEKHLVRVLEGIIEQTEIGADLKVVANPRSIDTLEPFLKELKDLNVNKMIPDISLEPGGCIVHSNGQEWDLTFEGQFETLSAAVREAMLYGGTTGVEGTDVSTVEVVT